MGEGARMLQFHALGGLTITANGDELSIGGPRQRRLVAMLLIHRNSVVSVDRLAEAVFAGEPTPAASTTLRSYVARIRRVVDANGSAPMVVTQAPGYVLTTAGRGVRCRLLRTPARRSRFAARPAATPPGRRRCCAKRCHSGVAIRTPSSPTRSGRFPRLSASASCGSSPTNVSSRPSWRAAAPPR